MKKSAQESDIIPYNGILDEFKKLEKSIELFTDIRTIVIPKRVEKLFRMKRLHKELFKIHKDIDLAIEYCLIFLSNFVNIHYDYNNQEKWKALSSVILLEQIPGANGTYKRVIELLSSTIFSSSPLIEINLNDKGTPSYQVGVRSIEYRLSNQFSNNGFIKYTITSETLIKRRLKLQDRNIRVALDNPIATNLLTVYPKLTLPTEQEILLEAKRLVKEKYLNNKGKKLTILNGQKKSLYKDFGSRVSYEDSLKAYKNLTDNGISIPSISGEKAGGRVYDSFNMMPSFIRNLIKIDNEKIVNVDLKCLHPNLGMKLYGGNSKYLTHQEIAEKLKLDLNVVKVEHLSFFNKHPEQMKQSQLFEYYNKNEPKMLENLIEDKYKNDFKITSQRMFKLEVEIMTECIERLNKMKIYPLYVFDALLINYSYQNVVEFTMNEVLEEMGIYTIVGSHKSPSFIRMVMEKTMEKGTLRNY
jgi:hypothetical protein